jgi:peptidoglycan/LPS O-acetylase OafA/YrhL
MEEKRSNLMFLDGLRGIAALYVMAGHARWLLWEGYNSYQAHKANYNIADKFFVYFLEMFKFGHEFVLFFFVLSGFVIHLRYAKNLHLSGNAKFNWGEYVYKRAKRIYPPFIFAILLTMFLDFIGTRINPIIYEGHTANLLVNKTIGNPNHEVLTFFGNLAFLYQEYVPIFGTNGPTWSLKYEWWFYMLYPLFLFLGKKHIIYPTIILLILFVASITISHWPEPLSQEIFGGMLAWWFGVLLCEIYVGRINI